MPRFLHGLLGCQLFLVVTSGEGRKFLAAFV